MPEDAETKQHNVYVVTKGRENPELALLPFVHAVGAQAMDIEATVVLLANAVTLARKDDHAGLSMVGMQKLDDLIANFFEMGGKMLLCGPCIEARGLKKEEFYEQAQVVGAGEFAVLCAEADAVINY